VAGVITHRQRPATASGVTFINLEDETGMSNIVVSIGAWTATPKPPARQPQSLSPAESNAPAKSSTSTPENSNPSHSPPKTKPRDFR
jgi:error-prone DNA polymerase